MDFSTLLGSVCIDGVYVKKDIENKIHLTYYDRPDEELDLGNLIDVIDSSAFCSSGIKSISGNKVEKIGNDTFTCSSLEAIDLPNLKEIGKNCFSISKLKSATLNNIKVIPEHAFEGTQLRSFRGDKGRFGFAKSKVAELAAFWGCKYLNTIILPKAKVIHTLGLDLSHIDLQVPESCEIITFEF